MNNKLRCSLWNVCSLNKKVNEVMEHLSDHECDIAFFTETWLTSERNRITADIKDHGFTLKHNIRNNPEKERGGGGVGIAFKSTFLPHKLCQNYSLRLNTQLLNYHVLIINLLYQYPFIDFSMFPLQHFLTNLPIFWRCTQSCTIPL